MDNTIHDAQRLKELQALPLERKVQITQNRIQEWYMHYNGSVFISFSGGKDSTVLVHLARQLFPDIPLVFSNTGLEYTAIQQFAKEFGAYFIYPKITFDNIISTYGYPMISKEVGEAIHYARQIYASNQSVGKTTLKKRLELQGNRVDSLQSDEDQINSIKSRFNKEKWYNIATEAPFLISHYCCTIMKKLPMKSYQRANKRFPIFGTLATESAMRKQAWIRHGCNAFHTEMPRSQPMSFWTEQDVLSFIKLSGIKIADVYGDIVPVENERGCHLECTGCSRTGCVFCGFGTHQKSDNRFLTLANQDPRKYEYAMNGGQWVDNPKYDPTAPKYDGVWKNWNPKKIWVPSKEGLGLKKVFEMFNELYPANKIKYE